MSTRHAVCALTAPLILSFATAWGDQADDTFESVFGPEIARVTQSREIDDDIDLAERLLKTASQSKEQGRLVVLLLENSYTLGMKHPKGFETAYQAARRLKDLPDAPPSAFEKLLTVRTRQYNMARGAEKSEIGQQMVEWAMEQGEAKVLDRQYEEALKLMRQAMAFGPNSSRRGFVTYRIRTLTEMDRAARQAAVLKDKLKEEPTDEASRLRLLQLYVVDLDDPEQAAAVLTRDCDERYRTYLPLVQKDDQTLADTACLELADWYRSLAEPASQTARPNMLRRAKRYYDLYLDKHKEVDATRMKADMIVKAIGEELEKQAESLDPWIDLIKDINPKRDGDGRWTLKGGRVSCADTMSIGAPNLSFPALPKGAYDLQLEISASRLRNSYTPPRVELLLPVSADRYAAVVLNVDSSNKDYIYEESTGVYYGGSSRRYVPSVLTVAKPALIEARVLPINRDNIEVIVYVNKKPHLSHKSSLVRLSPISAARVKNAHRPTMLIHNGSITVSLAKLRMLRGTCDRIGK